MANAPGDPKKKNGLGDLLRALGSKRMLVVLLLGFASGLPIMLVLGNLKLWLRRSEIDLTTIGLFASVMMPYSLKFLWAPFLDRFSVRFFGRRRFWILIAQIGLALSIFGMGSSDPKTNLGFLSAMAFLVIFFSATQDIAIDAYRREILKDEEIGIGSSLSVYGYRIAMFVASGFGIWIVDPMTWDFSFNQSYYVMATIMALCIPVTLWASEPDVPPGGTPRTLSETVVEPFADFFKRRGALIILLFIFFFKFGDTIAGSLLTPFYADVGFQNHEIAEVAKLFGLISSLSGLFIGGVLIYKLGIYKCLWIFGILQALSTLSFSALTITGPNWWALVGVVAFEDVTSGMGTSAMVAFMSGLTNKRFTATQYALLSSITALGRSTFAIGAGAYAEKVGYALFFQSCFALAIPGLVLLFIMIPMQKQAQAAPALDRA